MPNQEFSCKGQGIHLSPRRYLLRLWRRRALCQTVPQAKEFNPKAEQRRQQFSAQAKQFQSQQ